MYSHCKIILHTKGISVRDVQLQLDDLYGYELSTELISNMPNKVLELAKDWQNRALDQMYPIIFIDATVLSIRIDSALP